MEPDDRPPLTPGNPPVTDNDTVPLNPPTGATVITELVPPPGNVLTEVGFGLMVKSELALTVRLIGVVWVSAPLTPCTVIV